MRPDGVFEKVLPYARRASGFTLRRTGLTKAAALWSNGTIALYYHGVEREVTDSFLQGFHIRLSEFERQIHYLEKNFEIISLDDLSKYLSQKRLQKTRRILLTFDDGFRNNLSVVAPVLAARNIPFAVFVSTRHIEEQTWFPMDVCRAALYFTERRVLRLSEPQLTLDLSTAGTKYGAYVVVGRLLKTSEKKLVDGIVASLYELLPSEAWTRIRKELACYEPLSWDEVRELRVNGATVGSHCDDHLVLHESQSAEVIKEQLTKSKASLERELGEACRYFAYPNGDVSTSALACVEETGFTLAFTTHRGEITGEENVFLLPRIRASTNLDAFLWKLNTAWVGRAGYLKWTQGVSRNAEQAKTLR